MRVLIIGAGNAGRNLATKLCAEKRDVVLIDRNPDALAEVQSQLDILTIEGEGSSPVVLDKAEVAKADLVVAVTDSDETNILACVIAHVAGVPHKVARVSNRDFLTPPKQLDLQRVGIDLVVSQKEECASELLNILRMPGTLESVDLLDGNVLAVGIRVHMDSPLLRSPLRTFPNQEILRFIRFISIVRGDDLIVPRGDTEFLVGDDAYFVGRREDVSRFLEWAWPERAMADKVVIAGGGDLGLRLAQLLEGTDKESVLIELSEERAHECSERLDRTLVIKGDALDRKTLENAGVQKAAFVATMHDDENNIIACLLAEKMGAHFTLAEINKPEYVPIVNDLSLLDRAVSPPLSMVSAILHFVRGKYVKEAALFHHLPGELLDMVLPPKSKWAGKAVKDIKMPLGVVLAGVLRNKEVLVPTGDLVVQAGDRLAIFAIPQVVGKLESIFRR